MAQMQWRTFRKIDMEVVSSFEKITSALGTSGVLQVRLSDSYPHFSQCALTDAAAQPVIVSLINSGQAIAYQFGLSMQFGGYPFNAYVRRETNQSIDTVTIEFNDQATPDAALKVHLACAAEFPTYARAESIERLLGNELAEFYRAREAALLQLETLTQKLISDTASYRQKLDEQVDAKTKRLDSSSSSAGQTLRRRLLRNRNDSLQRR